MSPASQGGIEVERYIGSCLITANAIGRSSIQKTFNNCRKQETGVRSNKPSTQQQYRTSFDQQQCNANNGQFNDVSNWAGGAPLINMTSNPRRINNGNNNSNQRSSPAGQQQAQQSINEQQLQSRVPLARLAVHTQGAPLILSNRFSNNRNNKVQNNALNCNNGLANNNVSKCHPQTRASIGSKSVTMFDQRKSQQQFSPINKTVDGNNKDTSTAGSTTTTTANVANIDSLSIASDESSGSNNSENSLPRIIKPRKRRKKDRKPAPVLAAVSSASDVKAGDENLTTSQAAVNVVSEQQAQQIKTYQSANNIYDANRYSNEHYYNRGGPRRSMSNLRESVYTRLRNNSTPSNSGQSLVCNAIPKQQEVVDTRQQTSQQLGGGGNYPATHRHVQVKVLDDNRNVILPVPVCQTNKSNYLRQQQQQQSRFIHEHCAGEPVTLACHQESADMCPDDCGLQNSSSMCRYCDPATLIWDVSEQYSRQYVNDYNRHRHHHHHHHHHRFSQMPATVFLARPVICQEHPNAIDLIDVTDNPCLRLRNDSDNNGVMLRRSWSDPTSYFSDEIVPNRDVGVIGDRGGNDAIKGRSSWRGDASTSALNNSSTNPSSTSSSSTSSTLTSNNCSPNGSPNLPGPLEVSTEIVTSLNGHRDLEIKFFSSSPTSYYSSASSNDDTTKSIFGFTDDDASNDSEEFSDIWSYHESKLQQDFRTLLQAEE